MKENQENLLPADLIREWLKEFSERKRNDKIRNIDDKEKIGHGKQKMQINS